MATVAQVRLSVDSSGAKRGANEFDRSMEKVDRGARRADRSIRRTDKATVGLGRTLRSARGFAAAFGVALGVAGVAAAARAATKTITDYDTALRRLQAVTEGNAKTADLFNETARRLGSTTEFTSTQAAGGLLELARAGFEAEQATRVLPQVLNLATAAQVDLSRAAEITGTTLKQFALDVEQSGRVTDVLVKAATSANVTVENLAEALKFVGPVAADLGISLEETTAALAQFGDAGLKGGLAGRQFRSLLIDLLKPTEENAEAIERLGLSTEQLNVQQNGLLNVARALRNANIDAGLAAEFLNKQAIVGASILGRNSAKVAELTAELRNAGGATDKAAKTIRDGLKGAFDSLAASTEAAQLALGDAGLTGVLTAVVNALTSAVDNTTRLIDKFDELDSRFLGGLAGKALEFIEFQSLVIQAVSKAEAAVAAQRSTPGSVRTNQRIVSPFEDPATRSFAQTFLDPAARGIGPEQRQQLAQALRRQSGPAESVAREQRLDALRQELELQDELNDNLQFERKIQELTAVEQARQIARREALNQLLQDGKAINFDLINQAGELAAEIEELAQKQEPAIDKAEQLRDAWRDVAQQGVLRAVSAVEQVAAGSAKAGAAVRALLQDIARLLVQRAVIASFDAAFPTTASAKGNAFVGGNRVQAFASGGVVDSPIAFPLRNGIGVAGEAGAEGILPLQRTANGDLGVKAEGNAGAGQTDALLAKILRVLQGGQRDSFRRSPQQSAQDARARLRGA